MEAIKHPLLALNLSDMDPVNYFNGLLKVAINGGLIIGSIIFAFILISGGIQWIMAGSDKAKYQEARERLVNGLIGIFILFSVFAIIVLIQNIFGVEILSIDISSLYLSNAGGIPGGACPGGGPC